MGYYADRQRAVRPSETINNNCAWAHNTDSLRKQLEACHSTIQASTDKAIYIAADGKAMVLFHLQSTFQDLSTLAGRIAGDFDTKTAGTSVTFFEGLPSDLMTHVKDAADVSKSSSTAVRAAVARVTDARARIEAIRSKVSEARFKLATECAAAEQDVDRQTTLVSELEAKLYAVEMVANSEDIARAGNDAKQDEASHLLQSQGWWEWFSGLQALPLGGKAQWAQTPKFQKNLKSLMDREAAAVGGRRVVAVRELLELEQAKLPSLEARYTRLDGNLEQLKKLDRVAEKYLKECDNAIACCQEVDGVMALCQQNLSVMYSRCKILENFATMDLVEQDAAQEQSSGQTKEDYVNAILGCLTYGLLDTSLVDHARLALWALEIGDDTKLLQQARFAIEVASTRRILADFADYVPSPKL